MKIQLWLENKKDKPYTITNRLLRDMFMNWIKLQKHKDGYTKEWLENLGSHQVTIMFITAKDGLNSVAEQDTYNAAANVLKDDFWAYVESLDYK